MNARWVSEPVDRERSQALQAALRIHPVLCDLLVQRGIYTFDDAKRFFRPNLADLHDPLAMAGMADALDRIDLALSQGERIRIYGDYDVDGTTAVALVYGFFKRQYERMGSQQNRIDYYIPDRYKEGYGVSEAGIRDAIEQGVDLLITLDCGIKAAERIEQARAAGMDVIVCDHHLPPTVLPPALAVLDPKRSDCTYPYKELSGAGIGLKLVQGWCERHGRPAAEWQQELDLVAVSIAADIVPMTGENRTLTYHGMRRLEDHPRPGFRALMDVAGIKAPLSTRDLVFGLGPRINAAGRMGHGSDAVSMLLAAPGDPALDGAAALDEHNKARKTADKHTTQQALDMMAEWPDLEQRVSTVVQHDEWHKGVVGIVASRLIEKHHRPTVVLTRSNGLLTGSARSVPGFDLHEAIVACADLLERFGGHTHAAGLTMLPENLSAFRERFEAAVRERITPEQLQPELRIAADLPLEHIQTKFYGILRQFAPFGPGNPAPIFRAHPVQDSGGSRVVGSGGEHLKLDLLPLSRANGGRGCQPVPGIAFGRGADLSLLRQQQGVAVAFELEENFWKNRRTLQLQVKDLRDAVE